LAPDGFGFSNSPFEISHIDFGGKTIVQRTSAGTQGIVVSAAYDRPAAGRNEPAKFEWPALLRKLDRIDSSYKQ
jgi:2-phosphosulfolactate phosphatase